MLNTEFSSWECLGKATHCEPFSSATRATRTPPIGPENGRPESWVDMEEALMATTS
jgi:hypothetical protein